MGMRMFSSFLCISLCLASFFVFLSGIFLVYNGVILEDQSRTTYENLLYSKKLGEKLVASSQFLFVTNDYHVFRTSTYARKLGMKGDGLGCRTAGYYIPSAFIREFVALCVKLKWIFVFFYGLLFLALLLSYKGILW